MAKWTSQDIPENLKGKTYVITGTSAGIGTFMALELASRGAYVITLNRNTDKARKALANAGVTEETLSRVDFLQADISSLNSVRQCANDLLQESSVPHIDGLLLNAGIMALPKREISVDGLEMQMATNVFGHHLLTSLLLPKILAAPGTPVIVSTGSGVIKSVHHPELWDDINAEKKYDPWQQYALSKTAAIHFRDGLLQILGHIPGGDRIKVIATHPGVSATSLFDHLSGVMAAVVNRLKNILLMPADMGALPTLRAAVDENIPSGAFVGPDGFLGVRGYPAVIEDFNKKISLAPELRSKMWQYCDQVTQAQWGV